MSFKLFTGSALVSAFVLVGCNATKKGDQASDVEAASSEKITLNSITVSGNMMPGPGRPRTPSSIASFDVLSSGCTTSKDFTIKANQTSPKVQTVVIKRIEPDLCEAVPHKITIEMPINDFQWNKDVIYNGKPFTNVIKHLSF